MINIQLAFILLFSANLLLIWSADFSGRLSGYRLPGSFIFALLPLLTVFFDQPRFELDYFWWRAAGAAAISLGAGLLVWASVESRKFKLNLVVSGPYQYVRHPMYLGLIFIFVGWWWVWAAVYSFYFGLFMLAAIWVQGYLEEKLILEKKFGGQYRAYRQRTGMFWVK